MNVEEIENMTIKNCPICKGKSIGDFTMENNFVKINYCSCVEKFKRYCKYNEAGISQEWWDFNLEDIEKDFSKSILEDIRFFQNNVTACIINKAQFHFHGKHGDGKNLISNMMLKSSISGGHKCKFLSASFEIIDYLFAGRVSDLMQYDFLVLDEIDKIMGNRIVDTCNVIVHLMEYKSLVLLSNSSISDFSTKLHYPQNFIDRLKNMKDVPFPDVNYRGKFLNKFDTIKENFKSK